MFRGRSPHQARPSELGGGEPHRPCACFSPGVSPLFGLNVSPLTCAGCGRRVGEGRRHSGGGGDATAWRQEGPGCSPGSGAHRLRSGWRSRASSAATGAIAGSGVGPTPAELPGRLGGTQWLSFPSFTDPTSVPVRAPALEPVAAARAAPRKHRTVCPRRWRPRLPRSAGVPAARALCQLPGPGLAGNVSAPPLRHHRPEAPCVSRGVDLGFLCPFMCYFLLSFPSVLKGEGVSLW